MPFLRLLLITDLLSKYEMKKYTANYAYTNPNFVIQNLITNQINTDLLPTLYVLKNILQRGFPTTMSKYLQSNLGEIHKSENFKESFLFVAAYIPTWKNTIKGDKERNYYPAKEFFEKIIPNTLGEYSFIQSLILPEIEINEITGEEDKNFINQQVDFYLPQAKLVIEIDGQQHKLDEVTRLADVVRDNHLSSRGIETIRITSTELKSGGYLEKIKDIIQHLERFEDSLSFYRDALKKIMSNGINEVELKTKLLPTAIIRFQILLIELLTHNYISFENDWKFNILCHEKLPDFADFAIKDLLIWLEKLIMLRTKQVLHKPDFEINLIYDVKSFKPNTKSINIDFSLFQRYTDENVTNPDVIFIRTDYFGTIKNYFKVSTTEPVNYQITHDDKPILEFFLENIFDKINFREGQFAIIANALNMRDTIGLLPTGGGKSLCYQLPCLLQPSVSFVVCPIKSLMYDQNDNLDKILVTNVSFITSDLVAEDRREIERNFEHGRYLFVWISPEKFQIPSFRERVSSILANFSISYAVVDEVHCLSEWGHDFRTSYLNLAKTIEKLSPKEKNGEGKIKFIGLTATASVNVLKDIKIEFARQKQRLDDENIISLLDYSRKELQFQVINDEGNKAKVLDELLLTLNEEENFIETSDKAGLIFTPNVNGDYGCFPLSNSLNTTYQNKVNWYSGSIPSRKLWIEVENTIANNQVLLQEEIIKQVNTLNLNFTDDEIKEILFANRYANKSNGNSPKTTFVKLKDIPVLSAKNFAKHREKVQKDFKNNKYQLLVATKAFGMGIDKANVFYTFHYGLSSSVEALYQEAGRAGRWDKSKQENINKIGKCFILHSQETHDKEKIDRLFERETTFSEIKSISTEVGFGGRDIFKQVFLFLQGQNDIERDFEIILGVIRNYYKENSKVRIFWNDALNRLGVKNDILQKAIYRLSLLGIATDWTTNFIDHFEVQFQSLNEKHIIDSISNYITKYEPNADVDAELDQLKQNTILEKAIWYLLSWTFDNIAFNRKESLKTLSEWCSDFTDSDSFKKRIDSYFKFTDTTFILQHILEYPKDYLKWFDALYLNEATNHFDEKKNRIYVKVHIPEMTNTQLRTEEYQKLRDGLSRFYESSRGKNDGVNFLSGFVHLALDDYENGRGRNLFENTLLNVKKIFNTEERVDFLQHLKLLGRYLSENQQMMFCTSIIKEYPEMLEELAELYGLDSLLNDAYASKLQLLKELNRKLYEQLAKI